MKLRIEQLSPHLKKPLLPIYLITGDELLLVQETVAALTQTAQNAGFNDRILIEATNTEAWQQLTRETQNLSLFSNKRIIECRIPQAKLGDHGGKTLQQYTQQIPEDTLLIIVTAKLTAAQQNTAWFKAIDKVGVIIQIWPINVQQLPAWLRQRINQAGLQIDNNVIQLLQNHVQGNLLAAAQEIEKLQLLFGQTQINEQQMAQAITGNNRFNLFELADHLLSGNSDRCLQILHYLQQEGNEPVLILWSITRELRTLVTIAYALSQGMTLMQSFEVAHVREQRKAITQQALKRHHYQQWLMLLKKSAYVDRVIKGMQIGNVWDELQQLVLAICGVVVFS